MLICQNFYIVIEKKNVSDKNSKRNELDKGSEIN